MQKLLIAAATAATLLALPLAAQATVYQFNANLTGAQQVLPVVTAGTGIATLFYNDFNTATTTDDTFNFSMSAFNLSGVATAFHIHAAAPVGANAAPVVFLDAAPFVNLKSGGTLLVGGSNVPVTFVPLLADLQAGLAYVNIHTAAHGGGEIRGQLTQVSAVPETSTYAMLAAGLGVIGFVARRRKQGQAR